MLNAQSYEKKSYRFSLSVVSKLVNIWVSRITRKKNSIFSFARRNKLDFKGYLQKIKKLIDPILHWLIDPVQEWITVENVWMDNHDVKFQSNQTKLSVKN